MHRKKSALAFLTIQEGLHLHASVLEAPSSATDTQHTPQAQFAAREHNELRQFDFSSCITLKHGG